MSGFTGERVRDRSLVAQRVLAVTFLVTIVFEDVTDPGQDGLVLAEDPHAGTKARHGTSVMITVGRLVAQPPPPTTTAATTTTSTTTAATTTAPVATTTTP